MRSSCSSSAAARQADDAHDLRRPQLAPVTHLRVGEAAVSSSRPPTTRVAVHSWSMSCRSGRPFAMRERAQIRSDLSGRVTGARAERNAPPVRGQRRQRDPRRGADPAHRPRPRRARPARGDASAHQHRALRPRALRPRAFNQRRSDAMAATIASKRLELGGGSIDFLAAGSGPPLLFQHGRRRRRRVGSRRMRSGRHLRRRRPRPPRASRRLRRAARGRGAVDDIVYHYLDVMDRSAWERVVVGASVRRLDRRRAGRPPHPSGCGSWRCSARSG